MAIIKTAVLVVVMTFACLATVGADLITVDGDLTDAGWSGAGVFTGYSANDPTIADQYDIKYTRNVWDPVSGFTFFNMETWAQLAAPVSGNFAALMIDVDNDVNTGNTLQYNFPGAEYMVLFDLSYGMPGSLQYGSNVVLGSDQYGFFEWTGSAWNLMDNSLACCKISRGTAFGSYGVEWGIRGTRIGSPSLFTWGVFLDDGSTAPDDYVLGQKGQAPEPATVALFALGLAGMYIKRRYS